MQTITVFVRIESPQSGKKQITMQSIKVFFQIEIPQAGTQQQCNNSCFAQIEVPQSEKHVMQAVNVFCPEWYATVWKKTIMQSIIVFVQIEVPQSGKAQSKQFTFWPDWCTSI